MRAGFLTVGPDIAVLGAGIGGLAAALALARSGARVEVLERAPALGEVGAGLQISPNGTAVLSALGVAAPVAAGAPHATRVSLLAGASGRPIADLDLSTVTRQAPWLLVHRADLVAALAEAARAAGVTLSCSTTASRVMPDDTGVTIATSDGETRRVPVLVAADGVRGVARMAVDGARAPSFTGQVAWRALVPVDTPQPPRVRVWLAGGRHLVAYPLRDGRLVNLVGAAARSDWTAEGWHHADDPARFRQAFAGLEAGAQSLLGGVRAAGLWGLFRHPVAESWHRGRLVLLGDAVHPTLPYLAQGACMALEDAWVLARALSAARSPQEGFAAYQAAREARCRRIVAAGSRNAIAYHLGGPAGAVAHTILRLGDRIAPGGALRSLGWLYGHDVTKADLSDPLSPGSAPPRS